MHHRMCAHTQAQIFTRAGVQLAQKEHAICQGMINELKLCGTCGGKKIKNFLPFHRNLSPFPFAGWKMECGWGRTQGKVMMAKGYDKIVFFNQFLTHSMWRIKQSKKAVNVQESLHLFAWSPRTIHNLQLGHKVNWPYIATLPPLLLNQRKVKGLTGSSPEEQTQAASSFFIGTSPSLFSLISTFSLHDKSDRLWQALR